MPTVLMDEFGSYVVVIEYLANHKIKVMNCDNMVNVRDTSTIKIIDPNSLRSVICGRCDTLIKRNRGEYALV